MKRIAIVLFLLVALCHFQASSQTEAVWGVKAALDVNVPGKWRANGEGIKMYRHGFGGTLGGVCDIYFNDYCFVQPGVSLFYDTFSYDTIKIAEEDYNSVSTSPRVHKFGIRVPVVIGYVFDLTDRFTVSVFTGPEFGYAFSGKIRYESKRIEDMFDGLYGFGASDMYGRHGIYRPFDVAWKGGLGFPFNEWMVTVDAAVGITDVIKTDVSMRESRFSIGITRYF